MTRKYIEALAAALSAARIRSGGISSAIYNNGVNNAVMGVSDAIAALKPGFDRVRFLRDCGVQP